jgi:flavin reductase (DIM6/NTAB) family NADH-FMN oxidoreductase RutF
MPILLRRARGSTSSWPNAGGWPKLSARLQRGGVLSQSRRALPAEGRRHPCPLLREAVAWFECRVLAEYPAGDHVLVLGQVINGKLLGAEAEPMTYRDTDAMDGASALSPGDFGLS